MFATAVACGQSTTTSSHDAGASGTSSGGTGGSAGSGGTDHSLWPLGATKLSASASGGGPLPPTPAGSECSPQTDLNQFSVVIATKLFSFQLCMAGATFNAPYKLLKGSRTLSESEYGDLDRAMQMLQLSQNASSCGADKGLESITLTTPAGEKAYTDSFYRCGDTTGTKVYVDNIDAVFSVFYTLARAS